MRNDIITNAKGEQVEALSILNARERAAAALMQDEFNKKYYNALGYEINITTLYAITKQIIEQKFFEVAPADYMPVRVGEGAWSDNLLTYRDYQVAGDFETGNINTGASNSRLAEASSGVDSVVNKVITWAKGCTWTLADIAMASRSGNWDVVTSKERSRKRNWDLGIQRTAFLGLKSDTNVAGLLTQSGVTSNTSLITQLINSMNATQFSAFVAGLIQAYRANVNYSAWPTHFIIPEDDFNGLMTLVPGTAGTYPQPMLYYLEMAFKTITRNPNFKILPLAYAQPANNSDVPGLNKHRYTLLNYTEDSLRMDVPVDYTNTQQNTLNGFQFTNVGYGQYTGPLAYRNLEMLYLDF